MRSPAVAASAPIQFMAPHGSRVCVFVSELFAVLAQVIGFWGGICGQATGILLSITSDYVGTPVNNDRFCTVFVLFLLEIWPWTLLNRSVLY